MSKARNSWRRTALAIGATLLMVGVLAAAPVGAIVTSGGDGEAPVVSAGGTYTVDEGSTVVVSNVDVSDADGDSYDLFWSPAGQLDDPTSISPTYTAVDDGSQTLTLTATDSSGLEGYDTVTIITNNVAPTVGPIGGLSADPVSTGSTVSLTTTATDPGVTDTHTWTVDWGDGTTSSGTGLAITASHDYLEPGIYSVTVTVTDSDGATTTAQADTYVVVYDPSAGFVTGGGWIDSPAGAYTPEDPSDEDVVGKATFGFVAKYKKGASTPMGSTEFQLHANGMNFHSNSYDWLVVTGGSKAMFKGLGSVNGVDGYRFQVSAVDGGKGGVDSFRIKIVELATDTVLYDNQAGDADNGGATTALSQGSIVVHSK
ncbi:MAG: PKD domain-containing protein [Acidimicrobiales bacterium]